MAASSLSIAAEPGAASAEAHTCTLQINSKYEYDVTASVVCPVFFSLGFIYCFFGTYNATNAHRFQRQSSLETCLLSVVFAWWHWTAPALEAIRRDKHKSGGSRWTLSEFDTGSINEAPPVAPDLQFDSLNLA